jgi:putative DNA primase/helicase
MISAIARAYRLGCKVDTAIVFEGEQGRLKSTAIKVLGKDWTTDELAHLGSKDAAMQLVGVWLVEMAELEGITAAKVSTIKAFITRSTDRYRPPYGRRVEDFPRQCVFAGSVNENQYLRDATGRRRFWPVECKSIDIESLARDRDQLWAEARLRFDEGARWWFSDPALDRRAAVRQRGRHREDPWEPVIAEYLALLRERMRHHLTGPQVTVTEILRNALKVGADQFGNVDVGKWKQGDSNRVADCLKKLRWKRD